MPLDKIWIILKKLAGTCRVSHESFMKTPLAQNSFELKIEIENYSQINNTLRNFPPNAVIMQRFNTHMEFL